MTIQQKLQTILKLNGKTQTELAGLLQVSFPTLNSWANGKSTPRKTAQERIDALYQEYTGVTEVSDSELMKKKQRLAEYKKQFPNPLKNITTHSDLYDTFVLELTYHTNSIEGSTLSEPEVRAVIFDNVIIPNKTVIEHQEAKNHQAAFGNMMHWLHTHKKPQDITEELIQRLHSILMNGIRSDAGLYRRHGVRIVGSHVPTTNYLKIPERMQEYIQFIQETSNKNIFAHIAKTHAQFEQIHPFADGNGRIGRLLLQAQSLQQGYPPLLIHQGKKQAYYNYLQKAQLENNFVLLESFLCDALLESYVIIRKKIANSSIMSR